MSEEIKDESNKDSKEKTKKEIEVKSDVFGKNIPINKYADLAFKWAKINLVPKGSVECPGFKNNLIYLASNKNFYTIH